MISREAKVSAALLGAGLTFALLAYERLRGGAGPGPATGDAGVLLVYGQIAGRGPVRLDPDVESQLHRPQDLSFVWSVEGTGTRDVIVELDDGAARTVEWSDRLPAPAKDEPLPNLIELGDSAPDRFTLIVTIRSASARPRVIRYPIRLLAPASAIKSP
jgi:hypothetical protein